MKMVMRQIMDMEKIDIPEGICRYRFWNIAMATSRGAVELISLRSMLKNCLLTQRHHHRHEKCTVQTCLQNDENTTAVPQLHLCHSEDCDSVPFAVDEVNKVSLPEDGATAWSILPGEHKLESSQYMAISHVWSDGTGIGLKGPGRVNKCLVDHFENIAKNPEIGCDGLWWDTISLPTGKEQRFKALNQMHSNYKKAACTLVHDLELADYIWRDDGSPCLALAFSTWFSRGWTALELYMSENVWVLFKDSSGKAVLKNLDTDILACVNDPYAHPAHKAISTIIRRLRPMHHCVCKGYWCHYERSERGIEVHELLMVLKLRYTCWTRDRSIIARLIAGERSGGSIPFDSASSQTDITKETIKICGKLSPYTLFHHQVPMSETGSWSWCPPLIFDLNDSHTKFDFLYVRDGVLMGRWSVRYLEPGDEHSLKPHASHPLLEARVMAAFQNPEQHCLLYQEYAQQDDQYILAKQIDWFDKVRFVGVVSGTVVGKTTPYLTDVSFV